MKIKKVLNQNAVLVLDEGQEKVAVGKGVGFNKTKNDVLSQQLVERMFVMEPEGLKKLQVLLSQIEDKYFLASEEIIQHAETVLGEKLNEHINIGLSDHIAFAAENIQNNIIVRNKLLSEIEILYSEEFAIAQWAVEYLIEQELAIDIHDDKNSLSYSRLVNHLRLFIHRFQQNQYAVLDEEILEVVKKKYAESYEISKKVQVLLMRNFHYQVPNEELGYLSIHIERLRMTK